MSTESGHQVPVTGRTSGTATTRGGALGKEQKEPLAESGEQALQQVKHAAEKAYEKACDACHNWRHYPKLLTTVVLLSSFLLGAGLTSSVSRMGMFGSRHYVSHHWDRETADAHHALDVVLDHLKHPDLYRGERAETTVHKARRSIGDFLSGMLPSSWRRKGYTDELYERGQEAYDKATGRSMYDKMTGRGIGDKMGDMAEDIRYGARRGMESMKDTGYDIGHKLSGAAQSVKDTLGMGERPHYGMEEESWIGGRGRGGGGGWFGGGGGEREHKKPSRGGWFSGLTGRGRGEEEGYMRRGHDEEDEFRLASQKIKGMVRGAEREM